MFIFKEVEQGRVTEGKFASNQGDQEGCFIIPLTQDIVVQARTMLLEGWEILEAEQIIRKPIKKHDGIITLRKTEREYQAHQMPMGFALLEDLKRWFWSPTDVVITVFQPHGEDEDVLIVRESHMVKMGRPINGKLLLPKVLCP